MLHPVERLVCCLTRCLNVANGLAATFRLISPLGGHPEAITQKLATEYARYCAFGLVDCQTQTGLPQLRFASFAVINLRWDLHPQECSHAGRTKKKARGHVPLA